jgi:hypothetical protein
MKYINSKFSDKYIFKNLESFLFLIKKIDNIDNRIQ